MRFSVHGRKIEKRKENSKKDRLNKKHKERNLAHYNKTSYDSFSRWYVCENAPSWMICTSLISFFVYPRCVVHYVIVGNESALETGIYIGIFLFDQLPSHEDKKGYKTSNACMAGHSDQTCTPPPKKCCLVLATAHKRVNSYTAPGAFLELIKNSGQMAKMWLITRTMLKATLVHGDKSCTPCRRDDRFKWERTHP